MGVILFFYVKTVLYLEKFIIVDPDSILQTCPNIENFKKEGRFELYYAEIYFTAYSLTASLPKCYDSSFCVKTCEIATFAIDFPIARTLENEVENKRESKMRVIEKI